MDSDQLRLILLVLGVVLVVGIYLRDRFKRRHGTGGPIKMARNLKEPDFDLPELDDDVSEVRVRSRHPERPSEPYIEQPDDQPVDQPVDQGSLDDAEAQGAEVSRKKEKDLPPMMVPGRQETASSLRELGLQLDEPDAVERGQEPLPLEEGMVATQESQFSLDLEFNAHGDSDYLSMDPALMDEVPRLIVQINVMSKDRPFSAAQIQSAAAQVDLKYGEMNIYHRETDSGQVLFSMASVVEPGTFPKGKDENFSSPGVSLFTQLPGASDGLAIYADMLFTAERLSAILNAVLQDERRHKLTKQSIEHTREGILEHRRQIQLLRSRH